MKKIRILLALFILMSLSAFTSQSKSLSAYELMSRFNPKLAQRMTQRERMARITRIFAEGKTLSFDYNGVYLRFDYIGSKKTFIKLNGVSFSKNEISQPSRLNRLIFFRLGLNRLRSAMNSPKRERQFASETTASPLGNDPYHATEVDFAIPEWDTNTWKEKYKDDENQRGGVDFGDAFETTEICLFCDSQEPTTQVAKSRRQKLEMAYEMITGPEQVAMAKFAGGWMTGLNAILENQSTALDKFVNFGSKSPTDIKMPTFSK